MNAASTRSTRKNQAGPQELAATSRKADLPKWPTSEAVARSNSIAPTAPSSLSPPDQRRRDVAWRLQFQLLRGLEMLVRIAVLREWPRRAARATLSREQSSNRTEEPWRRQLSIGHGCSGPDLATPSVSSITTGDDHSDATIRLAVCVVGQGEILTDLVGRLLALGVQVHATAETVEDYAALRSAGAVPHRFEDIPAVASQIKLLISTSFSKYIGGRVLARLPANAVIVDLAGAPGSVDFETAQRLDLRPIWSPPSANGVELGWQIIKTQIETIAKDRT